MNALIPPAELGTILSVWAHPDDETYLAAGVMSAAVDRRQRVVCVSATAGEHGTADPQTWPPLRLGRRRSWEAAAAMAVLGVADHRILGFPDGALADHDEEGLAAIGRLLDDVRPDTILTFGPDGITFHPDHVAVSRWVTAAWEQRGRPCRLLYATYTPEHLARFGELYEQLGSYMTDERPTGVPADQLAVHVHLDGWQLDRKLTALAAMASQTSELMSTVDPAIFTADVAEEAFVDATAIATSTSPVQPTRGDLISHLAAPRHVLSLTEQQRRQAMSESRLPQLDAPIFLTDGGIETTLIFDDGFELPDFAAFTLLESDEGRAGLTRYFESYAAIAVRDGVGVVLETPTWRANPDWAARQGYTVEQLAAVNKAGVELLEGIRTRYQTSSTPVVISGCIGPRGDGYRPDQPMGADEAHSYHLLQARAFADSRADLITAITMTYHAEAIGVAEAARTVGLPVVISFTVETDGNLPTGESLEAAIGAVDAATASYPAYYMVNCAHPTHFADTMRDGGAWMKRIGGIRANASTMSHAELDEAEELDAGDPADLAQRYAELRRAHPHITVLGGCCGTSHHHIDAISTANVAAR